MSKINIRWDIVCEHKMMVKLFFAFILHPMKKVAVIICLLISIPGFTQIGGSGVFTLPKQASNARQLAWCGTNVAYENRDITNALNNPAMVNENSLMRPAMNINSQVPGVWSGNAGMGVKYKKWFISGQVMYIDWGKFDTYDAGGNALGVTNANEMLIGATAARQINDRLKLGAGLKMAYSVLGPYIGNGVMLDIGGLYQAKDSTWTVGAAVRNAGFMISTYNEHEKMPLGIEVGITIKPKHMPFRFNLSFHDLQTRDLTYSQYLKSNNIFDPTGSGFKEEASFGEKLMRHFTFGGEIVLGKNFGILMGYNHQRRMELAPELIKGVTGMGWGIDLKLSKFNLTYGSAAMFPGFNMNMFTVSAKIDDFKKDK